MIRTLGSLLVSMVFAAGCAAMDDGECESCDQLPDLPVTPSQPYRFTATCTGYTADRTPATALVGMHCATPNGVIWESGRAIATVRVEHQLSRFSEWSTAGMFVSDQGGAMYEFAESSNFRPGTALRLAITLDLGYPGRTTTQVWTSPPVELSADDFARMTNKQGIELALPGELETWRVAFLSESVAKTTVRLQVPYAAHPTKDESLVYGLETAGVSLHLGSPTDPAAMDVATIIARRGAGIVMSSDVAPRYTNLVDHPGIFEILPDGATIPAVE
jgi:hypothetical protein